MTLLEAVRGRLARWGVAPLRRPALLPALFFLVGVAAVAWLWVAVQQTERRRTRLVTQVTAEQVRLRLEAWVDARTVLVRYLAGTGSATAEELFAHHAREAPSLAGMVPDLQALNLVDREWVIRVVVPQEPNAPALGQDLHRHPSPGVVEAVARAEGTGRLTRTPIIDLLQGGRGFATYVPVRDPGGLLLGFVNGVFRVDSLVDSCLAEPELRHGFRFELREGDALAYAHHDHTGGGRWPHAVTVDVRVVDRPWRLRLAPSAAALARSRTAADEVMAGGAVVLLAGLAFALYALLRRQEALRDSRAKYRLLVENQSDLVVKLDPAARLLYASPSTCHLFETTEEAMLGRDYASLVQEGDREATVRALETLRRPPHRASLEQRVPGRDGWRWIAWSFSAVLDRDGGVEAVVGVGRDVTERRELEEQLVQSQRLQAVGQLAGGIAHDFNNILQSMMGSYEFLTLEAEREGRASKDLEQIGRSLERARQLTSQLLAIGRRQVLRPTTLELNRTVAELLHLLKRVVRESITLELRPAAEPLYTRADPGQVEQVVVNLCVNARDAVDEHGTIVISTLSEELEATDCAGRPGLCPGRFVGLAVEDNGRGAAPEVLERAFEPFFTTKEAGAGSGLGLAIVDAIVRQHRGLVRATSEPGVGSRFEVLLPAVEPPPDALPPPGEAPVQGGVETILVAEDDPEVREQVVRLLESAGYRVLAAADGVQAVATFAKDPAAVDLVLCDVVMPRMGGRVVAERVRALRGEVKVLFASGYDPDAVGQPNLLGPGDDFLAKPYRAATLLAKLREMLDR